MFSINSNRKLNESINKIPDILKRIISLEKFHTEQYTVHKDEYQHLITRQKKSENMMVNMSDTLDTISETIQGLNYVKEEELKMAEYIRSYDESLFQMQHIFAKSGGSGPQWAGQIQKTREQLWKNMKGSDISIISDTKVPVDYSLHEVSQIHNPEGSQKSGTIDEILTPGIIFKGQILKKAKVSVFK